MPSEGGGSWRAFFLEATSGGLLILGQGGLQWLWEESPRAQRCKNRRWKLAAYEQGGEGSGL